MTERLIVKTPILQYIHDTLEGNWRRRMKYQGAVDTSSQGNATMAFHAGLQNINNVSAYQTVE